MNGGVLHAVEILGDKVLAACNGYRFFGFGNVAALFEKANEPSAENEEQREERFNRTYWEAIPDDEMIAKRFRDQIATRPELYSAG